MVLNRGKTEATYADESKALKPTHEMETTQLLHEMLMGNEDETPFWGIEERGG